MALGRGVRLWTAAALAALLALAVVLGTVAARPEMVEDGVGPMLAVVGGLLGGVLLLTMGAFACLVATVGLSATGIAPDIATIQGVNLTAADPLYVAILAWLAYEWVTGKLPVRERIDLGQGAVLLFFGYIAAATLAVQAVEPGLFGTALSSSLRLIQTASLAWLAAIVIRSERDVVLLVRWILIASAVAVMFALGDAITVGDPLVHRFGGLLDPNALGLVAAVAVLGALLGVGTTDPAARIAIGCFGLIGLVLAKSVGSFLCLAAALMLLISVATSRRGSRAGQRVGQGLLAVALVGVVTFATIQFFRPHALPTSRGFETSSTLHRVVAGTGGLELFSDSPLVGLGWRRSDSATAIADANLSERLRRRFGTDLNPNFFPDVQKVTVHNTYVQLLAELGMIGMLFFLLAIWAVGRRVMELLRRLEFGSDVWRHARFLALAAVAVMVWLNDNPLYGGQPETILLAVTIGTLAAIAHLHPPELTLPPRRGLLRPRAARGRLE